MATIHKASREHNGFAEETLDVVVRIRTTPSIKQRLKKIAHRKVKRLPEVCREALVWYANKEDKQATV
jgi:hypothetical protein